MQSLSGNNTPATWTIISVDPDKVIELGHKLKQHAMDFALRGESLVVPLTDRILLLYEPEDRYTKPQYTFGAPAVIGVSSEAGGNLQ